jgi:hypothetical protein
MEAYPSGSRETLFHRILDLHRRQAKIVLQVLKSEVEKNSTALAGRSLPSNCLLVLHLGQFTEMPVPLPLTMKPPATVLEPDDAEEMLSLPGEPLTLMFEEHLGKPIVRVIGLCSFTHKVATVTFELKKQHEIDKSDQLPPDQYRYRHVAREGSVPLSKDEVRVLIARGRKQVSTAYRDMHGETPPSNLLFQTKQGRGYRLNPLTSIWNGG